MNKKVTSIVLNNFKNDSRVLEENISLQNAGYKVKVVALYEETLKEFDVVQNELRVDSKLYNNFLFHKLFDSQNIGFKKAKPVSHNKIIMFIRTIVPTCVLEKLKKVYHQIIYKDNKIDINNFNSFGDTIRSDINIDEDISFKNINGLFAFWLLNKELKR